MKPSLGHPKPRRNSEKRAVMVRARKVAEKAMVPDERSYTDDALKQARAVVAHRLETLDAEVERRRGFGGRSGGFGER